MNDKEKLISFINKGKENKPVKEVHVIKDSPTEAHILLVNEDGTNVASNRFEIMDARDLMTLIENPNDSGLLIDISEDNKKVVIKNSDFSIFLSITFDELDYNYDNLYEDTRFTNLANFIRKISGLSADYTKFFIRKSNIEIIYDFVAENISYSKFPFSALLSTKANFIICEGPLGEEQTNGASLIRITYNYENAKVVFQYSDGTKAEFPNVLSEYETFKGLYGEIYANMYS